MADMQAGIGPFLLAHGWESGLIGSVMTIGGVTDMLMTAPAGALVDATSRKRLYVIVPGICTVVTTFLSNDAAAVMLTPAVAAAVKTAKAKDPLPYLFICAFIANAASFVLPISNPENLVIYGSHMPPLLQWLPHFARPSLASILVTYAVLRLTQNKMLKADEIEADIEVPELKGTGKLAAAGREENASGFEGVAHGPQFGDAEVLEAVIELSSERGHEGDTRAPRQRRRTPANEAAGLPDLSRGWRRPLLRRRRADCIARSIGHERRAGGRLGASAGRGPSPGSILAMSPSRRT